MSGFIVASSHRVIASYLELIPATKRYEWLAAFPQHATVFTREEAEGLADVYHGRVIAEMLVKLHQWIVSPPMSETEIDA